MSEQQYPELPPKANRQKNCFFLYKGEIKWWNGNELKCSHKKKPKKCSVCLDLKGITLTDEEKIKNRLCLGHNCFKKPSFGNEGDVKPTHCKTCAEEGMVGIGYRKCNHPDGCEKQPNFGFDVDEVPTRCKSHIEEGMTNTITVRCDHTSGCDKTACFGFDKRSRCKQHIEEGMVDLKSRKCNHPSGCTTQVSYGFLHDRSATRCKRHIEEGMVDIRSCKCNHSGCRTQANYGFECDIRPSRCATHIEDGMVNIMARRCNHNNNCKTIPHYGFEYDSYPSRCKPHAEEGMIDIKSRRCVIPLCKTQPSYGKPGCTLERCASHKEDGDMRFARLSCITEGCREYALYGYFTPYHCTFHKASDELYQVQRSCIKCSYIGILDINCICSNCDPTTTRRMYLARQRKVKDHFDGKNRQYLSYDKIIDKDRNCLLRPDFIFGSKLTHKTVVEVDERQHGGRGYSNELERMIKVTSLLQTKTLHIRFNPDSYRPMDGNQVSFDQRLVALDQVLDYWANTPLPKIGTTFVIYMFFNYCDSALWKIPTRLV